MRLLVTGSTGFIGRHVIDRARNDGHDVYGLVRSKAAARERIDLPEENLIEHDFLTEDEIDLEEQSFDVILHLAFDYSANRELQETVAIGGIRRICESARRSGVKKVILVSSISVLDYSAISQGSTIDEQAPILRNRLTAGRYAYLKAEQESVISEQLEDSDTSYCILRPGLVYDDKKIENAHGGLKLGLIRFQIGHSGYVPVVEIGYLCSVMLEAACLNCRSGEVVHILDRELPSQSQYIRGLSTRRIPVFGSLKIPWNIMSVIVNSIKYLAPFLYRMNAMPDALRPNAFAARFKPFSFDSEKASSMFRSRSGNQFVHDLSPQRMKG